VTRRDDVLRLLSRARGHFPPRLGRLMPAAARDRLVRALPRLRAPLWCAFEEIRPFVGGARVCLFSHYDRGGRVADYVVHYLAALRDAGLATIVVSTAPRLALAEIARLEPVSAGIIWRANVGFDFGSWRTALLLHPEVLDADTLVLANDSVYGPLADLGALFVRMAGFDWWGITESLEGARHMQSYFLVFERPALRSPELRRFVAGIQLLERKQALIESYERRLRPRLERAGLRGGAVVPAIPGSGSAQNPTLQRWRETLAAGGPFVKVQLLRENPHRVDISDWADVVRGHGYDPELIRRHLAAAQR